MILCLCSSGASQGQQPCLIHLCIPSTGRSAWHREGHSLNVYLKWAITISCKVNKRNVSSCLAPYNWPPVQCTGPVMNELIAVLFYSRIQWLLNISHLAKCGKSKIRGEYIKKCSSVQALEYANFYSLEQVTWFELVTFNWNKTVKKKSLLYANDSICDPVKHSLVQQNCAKLPHYLFFLTINIWSSN